MVENNISGIQTAKSASDTRCRFEVVTTYCWTDIRQLPGGLDASIAVLSPATPPLEQGYAESMFRTVHNRSYLTWTSAVIRRQADPMLSAAHTAIGAGTRTGGATP
jgi:hypothetical protein